jgi:hypothetical protein
LEEGVGQVARLGGAGDTDNRIEFVDVTIGRDSGMVLGDAATSEEGRFSRVPCSRIDLHGGKMQKAGARRQHRTAGNGT